MLYPQRGLILIFIFIPFFVSIRIFRMIGFAGLWARKRGLRREGGWGMIIC
jgi:hypothetical protein